MWVGSERSPLCASANEELGTLADNTPLTGNKVYEVEEEISQDIRQAPPTKFPPTTRVGDVSVQVKVPPQRKRPPLVMHAGCGELASSGSDAWRSIPPTRMLIPSEDAASMVRLRTPPGRSAKGRGVMLSSAPPVQPDYVDLTKKVKEGIFEFLYMNRTIMGLDRMVQAF